MTVALSLKGPDKRDKDVLAPPPGFSRLKVGRLTVMMHQCSKIARTGVRVE